MSFLDTVKDSLAVTLPVTEALVSFWDIETVSSSETDTVSLGDSDPEISIDSVRGRAGVPGIDSVADFDTETP